MQYHIIRGLDIYERRSKLTLSQDQLEKYIIWNAVDAQQRLFASGYKIVKHLPEKRSMRAHRFWMF